MTAIESPARHAMTLAADWLAEQGDTVPHHYGEGARATNGDAPRYVWVPTRTRDRKDQRGRYVGQARELAAQQEHVEIDCWGTSDAEAWALRCNAWNALHQAFQADLMFEDGQWVRPGTAANQRGALYRLEVSISVSIVEGYIPLETLAVPEPELITIEGVEGTIFRSPATDVDGEPALTVTTD
jgi:hypothetical protein